MSKGIDPRDVYAHGGVGLVTIGVGLAVGVPLGLWYGVASGAFVLGSGLLGILWVFGRPSR